MESGTKRAGSAGLRLPPRPPRPSTFGANQLVRLVLKIRRLLDMHSNTVLKSEGTIRFVVLSMFGFITYSLCYSVC